MLSARPGRLLPLSQSLIPLFDKLLYPWLARRGIKFTMLQRIGIGFCLATAGVLCAGLVEVLRLAQVHGGHILVQRVAGKDIVAADLSVYWQIPQFALIGASEVFAATTGACAAGVAPQRWCSGGIKPRPVELHLPPPSPRVDLACLVALWVSQRTQGWSSRTHSLHAT